MPSPADKGDKRQNLPTANGNIISLKLQIPLLNPSQADFSVHIMIIFLKTM